MRAAIILVILPLLAAPASSRAEDARFMLCEARPHLTCVWSGDSFYLRGEIVRLSDAIAPERYTSECAEASQLSWRSALRLRDLLNAGPFELEDVEGSALTLVARDGQSLGALLVGEGLAKPRAVGTPNWCG